MAASSSTQVSGPHKPSIETTNKPQVAAEAVFDVCPFPLFIGFVSEWTSTASSASVLQPPLVWGIVVCRIVMGSEKKKTAPNDCQRVSKAPWKKLAKSSLQFLSASFYIYSIPSTTV